MSISRTSKVLEAKKIFDSIEVGHKNAVRRPSDLAVDRKLRDMISYFNQTNDREQIIINIQDGCGYFIAAPDEDNLVRIWKSQQQSRTGKCSKNVAAANRYLNRFKQSELDKNQITLAEFGIG